MSLKRAKSARKGFEGGIMVEVAGIASCVPRHASLCKPLANIPSPTSTVPIFSLDKGKDKVSLWGGGGGRQWWSPKVVPKNLSKDGWARL